MIHKKIITVGVGHNVNDYDEFVKVFSPYYPIGVIEAAYGRMVAKRQEMEKEGESFNVNANHYKGVAEIEIPREILAKEYYPKARALMNSWLKKVEGLKREGVLPPDFDFFQQPEAAQLVLFDMVYNLGPNKMMPVYMKNGKTSVIRDFLMLLHAVILKRWRCSRGATVSATGVI